MIPLSDDNSQRKSTPIVTYVLIALNVLFFLLELSGGDDFVMKWAFIPDRFLAHPGAEAPTILTSMFMHAGWTHLIGNMLYLWIFGDNVEDRLGKVPYLFFYLVCGIAATFAQLWFNPVAHIPNVGASGAIAGVLGAYIYQFPGEKVNVLLGRSIVALPALVVIGFWFVLQFFSSVATLSQNQDIGGVAYMAHIGGFITGFLVAVVLSALRPKFN